MAILAFQSERWPRSICIWCMPNGKHWWEAVQAGSFGRGWWKKTYIYHKLHLLLYALNCVPSLQERTQI